MTRMFGSLARPSAALLVALCAAAGCMNVDLAKSYPERRYYLLDAERQGPPAPVHFERNVTVHKCSVSPAFDGRELVYRLSDAGYASDFENQLFVAPGYAIAEEVRKWLAKSQLFANVVTSRSELESHYVVEPNLVELYGDYRDEAAPKAVLELQLYLIDDRQRPSVVLVKTDFRDERPLADSSAGALVEGWTASLRAALERFEQALQGLKPAEP